MLPWLDVVVDLMLLLMFMGVWIKAYVNVVWYWCSWMYGWFEMSIVTSVIIHFVYSHRTWYNKDQSTRTEHNVFIFIFIFIFFSVKICSCLILFSGWVLENNLTLNLNLSRHHHLSPHHLLPAKPNQNPNMQNNINNYALHNHIFAGTFIFISYLHPSPNPIFILACN